MEIRNRRIDHRCAGLWGVWKPVRVRAISYQNPAQQRAPFGILNRCEGVDRNCDSCLACPFRWWCVMVLPFVLLMVVVTVCVNLILLLSNRGLTRN